MKILLFVGVGSCLGGVIRYLLTQLIQIKTAATFPFGTLVVNIVGCFLIGLVFGLSEKISSQEVRILLTTGLLGGFTTFSSFSYETIALLRNGQWGFAFAYVLASVILGLLATFLSILIFRQTD